MVCTNVSDDLGTRCIWTEQWKAVRCHRQIVYLAKAILTTEARELRCVYYLNTALIIAMPAFWHGSCLSYYIFFGLYWNIKLSAFVGVEHTHVFVKYGSLHTNNSIYSYSLASVHDLNEFQLTYSWHSELVTSFFAPSSLSCSGRHSYFCS